MDRLRNGPDSNLNPERAADRPEPRASVVIPTYRRREATVRAVRGALAQTIKAIEVIVIDDASGDGTAEAIEAIRDPRVRILRQERNQGAAAARNRGILEARAPFVALLDSDDELHPGSIERRIDALQSHPESPFVYSRVAYALSPSVRVIAPARLPAPDELFIEALIITKGLATSALMARREALRECRFHEGLAGVDDWDVALKLARIGPPCFVEEALSIIHAEDETEGTRITSSFDPKAEGLLIELHRAEFDRSPRAEAAVLYKLATRAIRTGKSDLARDLLQRVITLDPAHQKAQRLRQLAKLGLLPILPALMRLRWRLRLAFGRVES